MQITKTTLRRIIKEELDAVLDESMQKMLGLPHQYTTQDLMRAVKGLIDSPRGDMTPGSREARDVETLISNHIRDKGTPEEKEALKKLRDDFLKSIGSVYRGHMATGAHAGQTRYEKSRQRRAHFRDAMNEDEGAPVPFEEAKALAIKEMKAAQAALTYAIEHIINSTGGGTYWEETEQLLDKLEHLMERFSREEPW